MNRLYETSELLSKSFLGMERVILAFYWATRVACFVKEPLVNGRKRLSTVSSIRYCEIGLLCMVWVGIDGRPLCETVMHFE